MRGFAHGRFSFKVAAAPREDLSVVLALREQETAKLRAEVCLVREDSFVCVCVVFICVCVCVCVCVLFCLCIFPF